MRQQRLERVGEMIHQVLGEIISNRLTDPRIGFTTVTRVEVTPDAKTCRVYVTTLGEASAQMESLAALKHAAGFIRRELAHELKLRQVPELFFYEDKVLHEADHIFEIIENLKHKKPDNDGDDPAED